jgi:hypothetical protein
MGQGDPRRRHQAGLIAYVETPPRRDAFGEDRQIFRAYPD